MSKPLILCIDDEKSILDSLESQLQSRGYGFSWTLVVVGKLQLCK